MDELENNIREDIEKEAEKYAPNDIENVWKTIEEQKKPSRWGRLSLVAACLTFVIIAAAVTGILLKNNGGFAEFSGTQSGALNPDSSEETVTFAEMHPELVSLPEGYRFIICNAKGVDMAETDEDIDISAIYQNTFSPESSVYLENRPEGLDSDYWTVLLKYRSEKCYTFRIYKEGYFAYLKDGDETNCDWYRNPDGFFGGNVAITFAEAHPDCMATVENLDLTVIVGTEVYYSFNQFEDNAAQKIYDYLMKGGSLSCFDIKLNIDSTNNCTKFLVGNSKGITVLFNVISSGLVSYYIDSEDSTVEGFFINPEGYDLDQFRNVTGDTLAEVHPELISLPEGYNIIYENSSGTVYTGIDIPEEDEWYSNYIAPDDTYYVNAIADTEHNNKTNYYIKVTLNDGFNNCKYTFTFYENGLISLKTDGEEREEWYRRDSIKWQTSETYFKEMHPDMIVFPEDVNVQITGESAPVIISGKDFQDAWSNIIYYGNALNAENSSDVMTDLLLQNRKSYNVQWVYKDILYTMRVYDNGYISLTCSNPLGDNYYYENEYYVNGYFDSEYNSIEEVILNHKNDVESSIEEISDQVN